MTTATETKTATATVTMDRRQLAAILARINDTAVGAMVSASLACGAVAPFFRALTVEN